MNARLSRLAPAFLLCTTLVPAQTYTGEGPSLFRPLAMDATMAPATFGFASIEGMACRREPGGDYYFGFCGRPSRTSPTRLVAWRRNGSTRAWTRLTHFDATAQDGDQHVTFTADLLCCAGFTNGVGTWFCQRPTIDVAWGTRRTITGLPADAYSPSFATLPSVGLNSRDGLVFCTSNPAHLYVGDFDRFSIQASNYGRLGPAPVPGIGFTSATAVDDPRTGETKRVLFGQRTNVGLQQQWAMTESLQTTARDRVLFNSPSNNVISNFCQLGGGSFLGSCTGPGIGQFPDSVLTADLAFSFDSSASSSREIAMTLCGPQQTGSSLLRGVMIVGVLGNSGIPIFGVTGNLGLHPSLMVILPAQDLLAVWGYALWTARVSASVRGSAKIQGIIFDGQGRIAFGDTAAVEF